MRRTLLLFSLFSLSSFLPLQAQEQRDSIPADDPRVSDLWFFQLKGPVKHVDIKSLQPISVDFDRHGRISSMHYGHQRVTLHRDEVGRLDSITSPLGRVDDQTTTKYRQRATDERGNWMARKTQRKPYVITTEHCKATYYVTN